MNIELPQKALAFALIAVGLSYLVNATIIATDFIMMLEYQMPFAYRYYKLLILVSNSAQHLSANPL